MRLKLLERDRLKGLAEEAERSAEGEAARVAGIEAALEKRLGEVTAIEQALTEVRACGVWCVWLVIVGLMGFD